MHFAISSLEGGFVQIVGEDKSCIPPVKYIAENPSRAAVICVLCTFPAAHEIYIREIKLALRARGSNMQSKNKLAAISVTRYIMLKQGEIGDNTKTHTQTPRRAADDKRHLLEISIWTFTCATCARCSLLTFEGVKMAKIKRDWKLKNIYKLR